MTLRIILLNSAKKKSSRILIGIVLSLWTNFRSIAIFTLSLPTHEHGMSGNSYLSIHTLAGVLSYAVPGFMVGFDGGAGNIVIFSIFIS